MKKFFKKGDRVIIDKELFDKTYQYTTVKRVRDSWYNHFYENFKYGIIIDANWNDHCYRIACINIHDGGIITYVLDKRVFAPYISKFIDLYHYN